MDTNRKLREHLATCKSDHPSTQLEQLNVLLLEVPEAFDKKVKILNLDLLKEIQNAAHDLFDTHPNLHNDLVVIEQYCDMLINGIVNRDEYLEVISPLQPIIEAATKCEQARKELEAETSDWSAEQINALVAFAKTLRRA